MNKDKPYKGLMKMPLLRQIFRDPNVKIIFRAVDNNWTYHNIFNRVMTGFNPYLHKIFIAKNSALAKWLKSGKKQDRLHNERDHLVREVLYLMHDYLHCWAVTVIQEEFPKLGLGRDAINTNNFENFVFCHLMTETAATVGLDYWFLATINLNEFCDLGTNIDNLTVNYHESKLNEYRKYNRNLSVQSPEFFNTVAKFYCDGQFPGFSISALKHSPQVRNWLEHELVYGETQRKYSRQWFSYLSGGKVNISLNEIEKPIYIREKWQHDLINLIAERLWKKIKLDEDQFAKKIQHSPKIWSSVKKSKTPYNFHFTNVRAIDKKHLSIKHLFFHEDTFEYFLEQLVSGYEFESFPRELLWMLSSIKAKKDAAALLALLNKLKIRKININRNYEPLDIFFLN